MSLLKRSAIFVVVIVVAIASLTVTVCAQSYSYTVNIGGCNNNTMLDIKSTSGLASINSTPTTASTVYSAVYIYGNASDGVTYSNNTNGFNNYNWVTISASGCTFLSATAHYWLYTDTFPLAEIYKTPKIYV